MSGIEGKNVLIFRAYGISNNHFAIETAISGQLGQLGANVRWLVCDGVFEQCDHHWQLVNPEDKKAACQVCYKAALDRRDYYSLSLEGLSEYITDEDLREVITWCERLDDDGLESAQFQGYPVGGWCKSSVNTQIRVAFIDFSNILHVSVYRQYLRSAALALIAYKRYLSEVAVDYVLLMNGRTFSTRVVLEISKEAGLPVAIHEFGRSEETRILRANENCHSLVGFSKSWGKWKDQPLTADERTALRIHFLDRINGRVDFAFNAGNNVSGEQFLSRFSKGKTAFALFTSSTDEIASAEGWGWKFTQQQWIVKVVDYFRTRPELFLFIRCHPNHFNKLMGVDSQFIDALRLMSLPRNVQIIWPDEKCDTYSLVRAVEAVFAYNSTVALESVLLGKRVYLGGGGLFRGRGFCWETDCELENVPAAVERFITGDELCDRDLAERFYYLYFFRQVYDVPFIKRTEQGLVCKPEAFVQLVDSPLIKSLVDFYCYGTDFFPVPLGGGSVRFSVILTTYNRPRLLKDALESLRRQSYRNFEVVLVNDNGEPVEHLLAGYDFPITYLRQGTNSGLSAARNAGLKLARGRHIVYLDDDDIYLPNHLAVLAEALERNPQSVVYTAVEYVTEKLEGDKRIELDRSMPLKHDAYDRNRLFIQNYIPVNTWAHPRSMLAVVGEFDTGLTAFEDWDMLLRLAARYPFVYIPQVTAEVHQRPSAGNDHMLGREQKNFVALYQKLYERHSDLGSEVVRAGRQELLKRLGANTEKSSRKFTAAEWLGARTLTEAQKNRLLEALDQQGGGPVFGIVLLDLKGEQENLQRSLDSLRQPYQSYARVQPIVLTVSSEVAAIEGVQVVPVTEGNWLAQLNGALSQAALDWFIVATAGEEFTANGLLVSALDLASVPGCRAVYADEMMRQDVEDLGALLRPDLNLDLLLSLPASMAHHWLFRRDLWLEMGGFAEEYPQAFELEYILRLIERGGFDGLGHISEPLLITDAPVLKENPQEREVIARHLIARGYHQPVVKSRLPGRYEIDYGHPLQPRVSILIVVKDRFAWVQRCLESLLAKTAYPNFEVLLLDHGNTTPEIQHWLAGIEQMGVQGLRVLRFEADSSREQIQNQAAQQADGEYLLWLGDGAGIIATDWLKELLNHALRPEVGAVGAKLLSGDGLIRHAGGVLGLGGPVGRAFFGHQANDSGYMQRLQVDQNYSALSGYCLLVRRELFLDVGGFTEEPLLSRWADADLCLRIQQRGFLNVWTPRAQLLMDEPPFSSPSVEEEDAMYARWLPALAHDQAYNPSFALGDQQGFKLAPAWYSWKPLQPLGTVPLVLAHNADTTGCGHYRILQPHRALKEAGLIDGQVAGNYLTVTELERYNPDAIVLQRQIGETQYELIRRMQAFSRAFKVFELDDYILNIPLKSVHRATLPKDIAKSLRRVLGCVDRFVVSTEPLAEALAGMHGDIQVARNSLDPRWWGNLTSERRVSSKPRVGWAGGISHTGDLEMVADVVRELAGEVEWVFFGMCPDRLRPYVHEYHPGVDIELYPAALARMNLDLAIAPVEENLFNECKSNLRLLEYGACGFPVVCSDLVCYRGDLPVTRVRNRFKDWVEAIRMHLADLDATAKQGDALRAAVLRDWMLEGANLERWRQVWLP